MNMPAGPRLLRPYLWVVCAAGLLVFVHAVGGLNVVDVERAPAAFWTFALLVVLGELLPIKVRRRDEGGEVTTSSTFAFALLLMFGVAAGVLAQAIASVIADAARRKPWWRAAFNAAQYTLSLAAGGFVLERLATTSLFEDGGYLSLPALAVFIVAGAVVFSIQNVLTGVAIALDQGGSLYSSVRRDLGFNASTAGVLLALSPVLVVVAERSLPLIPLLLATVVALNKSARVSLEKQHEALHDLLTDLPNRRLFQDRLAEALHDAKRSDRSVAVMLIDLDRFKEINDTLGHHTGDLVLQQIGPRLRHSVREIDTLARLGGDEFAVLLPDVADEADALRVGSRIVAALDRPINVQGFPLDVNASIGVAVYPQHGQNVDVLMQRADVAMYTAKREHLGVTVYSDERDGRSRGRMDLLGQLREAIDEQQLIVHYQPKVEVRTGRVLGAEALLRWQHPELGMIPPDDFIPLAEHTELIGPLTEYVLEAALGQCAEWHAQGLMLTIAVNLSVHSLYDPGFSAMVGRVLGRRDVDAAWLELEITENTLMADPLRTRRVLAELSQMGVRLSIDDFGIGYSSLAHLKHLPVTEIKIDKSFVLNMASDDDDATIVRTIIDLARNLGLQAVAEGVETEQVWKLLEEWGCHNAQGYYLCRPVAATSLTSWLRGVIGSRVPPATEQVTESGAPRLRVV